MLLRETSGNEVCEGKTSRSEVAERDVSTQKS